MVDPSAARRCLFALPLVAWTCVHADAPVSLPSDLYYFVDDRGTITWSNLHSDARLSVFAPPAYSGVLTYTIAASPSHPSGNSAANANDSLMSRFPAAADADSESPDDTPMDH